MQIETATIIADSAFNHGSPCCSLMAKMAVSKRLYESRIQIETKHPKRF
jgi:hypothetical protein